MAEVFKKQIIRYTLNGKRVTASTPGAVRTVELSAKWYGTVDGTSVPLCSDKGKAQKMFAARINNAALASVGLADPFAAQKQKSLDDHLKDYAGHLEAKGDTLRHIALTVGRVSALFKGCEFLLPPDVDAGRASEWLTILRRAGEAPEIPPGETFTPSAVAELLGISGQSVRSAVKRHSLTAVGNGKARKYPRATVETLVARSNRGVSPETVNHYVRAVRGFFRWMLKAKRIGSNPLETLSLVNAQVEVRRARRELTADELRSLLTATRESKRAFRTLTGADRFHLYLTAAGTGFRARALANLTPEDFDLDGAGDMPTVTLPARFNKSRKPKVQHLPGDVAEELRAYLNGKPAGQPVWGGTWARDNRGAEMIRGDLKAAGIPYSVEGPDGPEYADFHALRHSYLTLGGRSGIDLRTLMELAGHLKPELTVRYSHRRLYDLAGAVDKLPSLVPEKPVAGKEAQTIPLQATGTEGELGCSMVAQDPVRDRPF
jgi:integrase/recombinase XerC